LPGAPMTLGTFKPPALAVVALGLIAGAGLALFGASPFSAQAPRATAAPQEKGSATPGQKGERDALKEWIEAENVELSGKVLDPDGKPFPGAEVTVRLNDGGLPGSGVKTTSGPDGG